MRRTAASASCIAVLVVVCAALAQQQGAAPLNKLTAQALRDGAGRTRCADNKACYGERATYYDCLATSPPAKCPEPKCRVVECPEDATLPPPPPVGSAAPPEAAVSAATVAQMGDAWRARIEAYEAAAKKSADPPEKQKAAAEKERGCYEYFARKLVQTQMAAKATRSCALRYSILPRMPKLVVPKKCDSEAMRAAVASGGRALVEGDLDAALERYTEAWLAAPDWSEVAVARALMLEALGRTEEAEAAVKAMPRTVARFPSWQKPARAAATKEETKCKALVAQATAAKPGGNLPFEPAECEGKK